MSHCPPTPQWQLRQIVKRLEQIASELVHQKYADAVQAHADGLTQLAEEITPAMRPDALTPAQGRVLSFIRQHIAQHDQPPTRKEISEAFGFSSANAAQEHVKVLERKGLITLTGGARGIRVNKRTTLLIEGNAP
jgi:DNA-binding MarR family transcriptional regulator